MKISIIVPAYNEENYLPATLEKIGAALENYNGDSETIVVDNESADKTAQIARDFGTKVFTEITHNISKVRNTGANNASGDVLIFIDADTIVPVELFRIIADAMTNEQCFGGAAAVDYDRFERKWMRWYLLGWKFWGTIFDMKQGATQFCRKTIFEEIGGYDENIYMGEDVMFYWRLSKFTKQHDGYLFFIENPKVTTSARRFDKMSLWKTFLLTHPFFILLAAKRKRFWRDWYEKAIR
jgi:glycosyltransferase involved in cell wall biosynthesis